MGAHVNTRDDEQALRDALRAAHAHDPAPPDLGAMLAAARDPEASTDAPPSRAWPALAALAACALVALGVALTWETGGAPEPGPDAVALSHTSGAHAPDLEPRAEIEPPSLDGLEDDDGLDPWGFEGPTDFLLEDALDTSMN
jgi:hypothetical protein